MKLVVKFNLVFVVVFLAGLAGAGYVSHQLLERNAKDEIIQHASIMMEAALAVRAYEDRPLPIGERQTISQPFMVGLMTQSLELRGDERVLEIGTGSGYQTAVLAELAATVFSIERIAALATGARETLDALGPGPRPRHRGDRPDEPRPRGNRVAGRAEGLFLRRSGGCREASSSRCLRAART